MARPEDILQAPFRPADLQAARALLESAPHVTTVLFLVSEIVRTEHKDEAGADLIDELVKAYAEHEAS